MSEKIYACLLRLLPSHFREAYGEAALQLFRDRAKHERGFFPTLQLWLDLLGDLAISIPREYRRVRPALIGTAVQKRLAGVPSFFVLEEESPGAGALIFGGAASLLAASVFSILLGQGGIHRPLTASGDRHQRARDERGSGLQRGSAQAASHAEDAPTRAAWGQPPTTDASQAKAGEARPDHAQSSALAAAEGSDDVKWNAAERRHVMDAVIQNLKKHYVDREVAGKMATALLAHEKKGDDNEVKDGEAFARLLTRQLRDVSQDMHLEVVYSGSALPDGPLEPTREDVARYRKRLEQENCAFKKVEILQHNIGYLKLDAFPEPSICQATATAAMAALNRANAIIFDLRENRGGFAGMVSLLAGYLFDHPEYLYDPRGSPTQESWTRSPVAGNRLADKPVYVLTSASTISAAEQFCYDLKMLKRATLVGETTGGSAHAGVFHRIDDHFGVGIPEARAINPYGKTDWAGTGVEPDVKVKAADALATAEKLAESRLKKRQ